MILESDEFNIRTRIHLHSLYFHYWLYKHIENVEVNETISTNTCN